MTHFVFNNHFFENRTVYYVMWKDSVQQGRPQRTKRRRRIACWITKTTYTHSEYVILIAFPPPQWLHNTGLSVTL